MKKRLLSILLSLAMILSLLPVAAFAAEEEESAEFYAECTVDDVRIKAYAPENVLPAGSTMSVSIVDGARATQRVNKAVDKVRDESQNVLETYIFDFVFRNAKGMKIEPNGDVQLFFEIDGVSYENIYHMKESLFGMTAEPVESVAVDGGYLVSAEEFSYYVIQFTYDSTYRFVNYEGVPLYEILNAVTGIDEWGEDNCDVDEEYIVSSDTSVVDVYYSYGTFNADAEGDYGVDGWIVEPISSGTATLEFSADEGETYYYIAVSISAENEGEYSTSEDMTKLPAELRGPYVEIPQADYDIVTETPGYDAVMDEIRFTKPEQPEDIRYSVYDSWYDKMVVIDLESETAESDFYNALDDGNIPAFVDPMTGRICPFVLEDDDGVIMPSEDEKQIVDFETGEPYIHPGFDYAQAALAESEDYQAFVNSVIDLFCMRPSFKIDFDQMNLGGFMSDLQEEMLEYYSGMPEDGVPSSDFPEIDLSQLDLKNGLSITSTIAYAGTSLVKQLVGSIDAKRILSETIENFYSALEELTNGDSTPKETEGPTEDQLKEYQAEAFSWLRTTTDSSLDWLFDSLPEVSDLVLPWTVNYASQYYNTYGTSRYTDAQTGLANSPASLQFPTLNSKQFVPFTAVVKAGTPVDTLPVKVSVEDGKLYTDYGCVVEGAYHPYSMNLPGIRVDGIYPGAGNPVEELDLESALCLLDPMEETELQVVYGCVYCYCDESGWHVGYHVLDVSDPFTFEYEGPVVKQEEQEIDLYAEEGTEEPQGEPDYSNLMNGFKTMWVGQQDLETGMCVIAIFEGDDYRHSNPLDRIDLTKPVENTSFDTYEVYYAPYIGIGQNEYYDIQNAPLKKTVNVWKAGLYQYFYAPFSTGEAGEKYDPRWDEWTEEYYYSLLGPDAPYIVGDIVGDIGRRIGDLMDMMPIGRQEVENEEVRMTWEPIPAVIYTDPTVANAINGGNGGFDTAGLINLLTSLPDSVLATVMEYLPQITGELPSFGPTDQDDQADSLERLDKITLEESYDPITLIKEILALLKVPEMDAPYAFGESADVLNEIPKHFFVQKGGKTPEPIDLDQVNVELVTSKVLFPASLMGPMLSDEALLSDDMDMYPDYKAPLDWGELIESIPETLSAMMGPDATITFPDVDYAEVAEILSNPDELMMALADPDPELLSGIAVATGVLLLGTIMGIDTVMVYEITDPETEEVLGRVRVDGKVYPQLDLVTSPFAMVDLTKQSVDGMMELLSSMSSSIKDKSVQPYERYNEQAQAMMGNMIITTMLDSLHFGMGAVIRLGNDITIPVTTILQKICTIKGLPDQMIYSLVMLLQYEVKPAPDVGFIPMWAIMGVPEPLMNFLEYLSYNPSKSTINDVLRNMGEFDFSPLNPFDKTLEVEQGDTSFWLYQYLRYLRGEASAEEMLPDDGIGLALAGMQRLRVTGGFGTFPYINLSGDLDVGMNLLSPAGIGELVNEWGSLMATTMLASSGNNPLVWALQDYLMFDGPFDEAEEKLSSADYLASVIESLYDGLYTFGTEINRGNIDVVVSGNLNINAIGEYNIVITPVLDGVRAEEFAIEYHVKVKKPLEKNILFRVDTQDVLLDDLDVTALGLDTETQKTTDFMDLYVPEVITEEEQAWYDEWYGELKDLVLPFHGDPEVYKLGDKMYPICREVSVFSSPFFGEYNSSYGVAPEDWETKHNEAIANLKSTLAAGITAKTEKNAIAPVTVTLSKIEETDGTFEIVPDTVANLAKGFKPGDQYLITYKAAHPKDPRTVERVYGILTIADKETIFYDANPKLTDEVLRLSNDDLDLWLEDNEPYGTALSNREPISSKPLWLGVDAVTDLEDILHNNIMAQVVDKDGNVLETIFNDKVTVKAIYAVSPDVEPQVREWLDTNYDAVDYDKMWDEVCPGVEPQERKEWLATGDGAVDYDEMWDEGTGKVKLGVYEVVYSARNIDGLELTEPRYVVVEEWSAYDEVGGWYSSKITMTAPGIDDFVLGSSKWKNFTIKLNWYTDYIDSPKAVVHIPRGFKVGTSSFINKLGGALETIGSSKDENGTTLIFTRDYMFDSFENGTIPVSVDLEMLYKDLTENGPQSYKFSVQTYYNGYADGDCVSEAGFTLEPHREIADDFKVTAGTQAFTANQLFGNQLSSSSIVRNYNAYKPYVITVEKPSGVLPAADWKLQFELPEAMRTLSYYKDKDRGYTSYPYVIKYYVGDDVYFTRNDTFAASGAVTVPLFTGDRYTFNTLKDPNGHTFMNGSSKEVYAGLMLEVPEEDADVFGAQKDVNDGKYYTPILKEDGSQYTYVELMDLVDKVEVEIRFAPVAQSVPIIVNSTAPLFDQDDKPVTTGMGVNLGASKVYLYNVSDDVAVASGDEVGVLVYNVNTNAGAKVYLDTFAGNATLDRDYYTCLNDRDAYITAGKTAKHAVVVTQAASRDANYNYYTSDAWNIYNGMRITVDYPYEYSPTEISVDDWYYRYNGYTITYTVSEYVKGGEDKLLTEKPLTYGKDGFVYEDKKVAEQDGLFVSSVTVERDDAIIRGEWSGTTGAYGYSNRSSHCFSVLPYPVMTIDVKDVTEPTDAKITTRLYTKHWDSATNDSVFKQLDEKVEQTIHIVPETDKKVSMGGTNLSGWQIAIGENARWNDGADWGFEFSFQSDSATQTFEQGTTLVIAGNAVSMIDFTSADPRRMSGEMKYIGYSFDPDATYQGPWNKEEEWTWAKDEGKTSYTAQELNALTTDKQQLTGVLIDVSDLRFAGISYGGAYTGTQYSDVFYNSKPLWDTTPGFAEVVGQIMARNPDRRATLDYELALHFRDAKATTYSSGKTRTIISGLVATKLIQTNANTVLDPLAGGSKYYLDEMELVRVGVQPSQSTDKYYGLHKEATTVFDANVDDGRGNEAKALLSLVQGVSVLNHKSEYGTSGESHGIKYILYKTNLNTTGKTARLSTSMYGSNYSDNNTYLSQHAAKGTDAACRYDPQQGIYKISGDCNVLSWYYVPFTLAKGEYVTEITVFWDDVSTRRNFPEIGLVRASQVPECVYVTSDDVSVDYVAGAAKVEKVETCGTATLPVNVTMKFNYLKTPTTVSDTFESVMLGDRVDKELKEFTEDNIHETILGEDELEVGTNEQTPGASIRVQLGSEFQYDDEVKRLGSQSNGNVFNASGDAHFEKLKYTVYYRINNNFTLDVNSGVKTNAKVTKTWYPRAFANGDGLLKLEYQDYCGSRWDGNTFVADDALELELGIPLSSTGGSIKPIVTAWLDITDELTNTDRGYQIIYNGTLTPRSAIPEEVADMFNKGSSFIMVEPKGTVKIAEQNVDLSVSRATWTVYDTTDGSVKETTTSEFGTTPSFEYALAANEAVGFSMKTEIVSTQSKANTYNKKTTDWNIYIPIPKNGDTISNKTVKFDLALDSITVEAYDHQTGALYKIDADVYYTTAKSANYYGVTADTYAEASQYGEKYTSTDGYVPAKDFQGELSAVTAVHVYLSVADEVTLTVNFKPVTAKPNDEGDLSSYATLYYNYWGKPTKEAQPVKTSMSTATLCTFTLKDFTISGKVKVDAEGLDYDSLQVKVYEVGGGTEPIAVKTPDSETGAYSVSVPKLAKYELELVKVAPVNYKITTGKRTVDLTGKLDDATLEREGNTFVGVDFEAKLVTLDAHDFDYSYYNVNGDTALTLDMVKKLAGVTVSGDTDLDRVTVYSVTFDTNGPVVNEMSQEELDEFTSGIFMVAFLYTNGRDENNPEYIEAYTDVDKPVTVYLRDHGSELNFGEKPYLTAQDFAAPAGFKLTASYAKRLANAIAVGTDGRELDTSFIKVDKTNLKDINDKINSGRSGDKLSLKIYTVNGSGDVTAYVTVYVTLVANNLRKGTPMVKPYLTAQGFTMNVTDGPLDVEDFLKKSGLRVRDENGYDIDTTVYAIEGDTSAMSEDEFWPGDVVISSASLTKLNNAIAQPRPGTVRVEARAYYLTENYQVAYVSLKVPVTVVDYFYLAFHENYGSDEVTYTKLLKYGDSYQLTGTHEKDREDQYRAYSFEGWATSAKGSAVYMDDANLTSNNLIKFYNKIQSNLKPLKNFVMEYANGEGQREYDKETYELNLAELTAELESAEKGEATMTDTLKKFKALRDLVSTHKSAGDPDEGYPVYDLYAVWNAKPGYSKIPVTVKAADKVPAEGVDVTITLYENGIEKGNPVTGRITTPSDTVTALFEGLDGGEYTVTMTYGLTTQSKNVSVQRSTAKDPYTADTVVFEPASGDMAYETQIDSGLGAVKIDGFTAKDGLTEKEIKQINGEKGLPIGVTMTLKAARVNDSALNAKLVDAATASVQDSIKATTAADTTVSAVMQLGVIKTVRELDENGALENEYYRIMKDTVANKIKDDTDLYRIMDDTNPGHVKYPITVTIPYVIPQGVNEVIPNLYLVEGDKLTPVTLTNDNTVTLEDGTLAVRFTTEKLCETYALTLTAKRSAVAVPEIDKGNTDKDNDPYTLTKEYTGVQQSVGITMNSSVGYKLADGSAALMQKDADAYEIKLALKDQLNYYWADGDKTDTTGTRTYLFTITPQTYTMSVKSANEKMGLVYVASDDVELNKPEASKSFTYSVGNDANATHVVTVVAAPEEDHYFVAWKDKTGKILSEDESYTFTVSDKLELTAVFALMGSKIAKVPEVVTGKTYDGNKIIAIEAAKLEDLNVNYTVALSAGADFDDDGNIYAIDTDTYTVTLTLMPDTGTDHYFWADGTQEVKKLTWTILKGTLPAPEGVTDGEDKILNVTDAMEYRAEKETEWTQVPAGAVEVKAESGTYYVRTRTTDEKNWNPSSAVIVHVNAPTLTVTTIQPADPTQTSATFNGTVSPFVTGMKEGFAYRELSDAEWTGSEDTVSATKVGDKFSATVNDLTPGTAYQVRAFVKVDEETTYAEQPVTFFTEAADDTDNGTILTEITNNSGSKVSVTIERGNEAIASANVTNGTLAFTDLPDGFYNIVVRTANGDYTETRLVQVKEKSVVTADFVIPAGKLATVVEVKESTSGATDVEGKKVETPAVAVDGLKTILDEFLDANPEKAAAVISGEKSIEVKLEVERKVDITATDDVEEVLKELPEQTQTEITKIIDELPTETKQTTMFLDMSLFKTTTDLDKDSGEAKSVDTEDIGATNERVIEIAVPYKDTEREPKVLRCHNGVAEELEQLEARPLNPSSYRDGTCYIGKVGNEKQHVFIYASGFSTYAISFDLYEVAVDPYEHGTVAVKVGIEDEEGKFVGKDYDGTDVIYAAVNDTVVVTLTPDEGYSPKSLTLKYTADGSKITPQVDDDTYTFDMSAKKDVTVTAEFEANEYTVTFDAKGGSDCTDMTVTYDSAYGTLPTTTKKGYTFAGWYKTADDTEVTAATIVKTAENHELYAKWTPNKYTVRFNANGGSGTAMADQSFTYDQAQNLSANTYTAAAGYHFAGWNMDDKATTADYDNGSLVSNLTDVNGEVVKFYAIWAENDKIEVKYQSNDINMGTVKPEVEPLGPATGEAKGATATPKEGYHFVNWTDATAYVVSTDTTFIPAKSAEGLNVAATYTANFAPNTYTVKFDGNGATGGTMADQSFVYDAAQNLRTNAFEKTGYTFAGWKRNSDTFTDGTEVKNLTAADQGVVTLVAQWTANKYTVTFDAKGGSDCQSIEVTYDSAYGTLPTTSKTGYTFVGWYNVGLDTEFTAATTVSATADHTLYAKWTANTYTVRFSANGGSGTAMADQSFTYDVEQKLSANTYTAMPGYHFAGWDMDDKATTASYNSDVAVENLTDENGAVVTLYAIWAENDDVEVKYQSSNEAMGTVQPALEPLGPATGVAKGATATPNEGYHFVNWTDATAYVVSTDTTLIPAKVGGLNVAATYTANFAPNTYTVTFNANNGKCETASTTVTYDSTYGELPEATRTGFTFDGWFTEAEDGTQVTAADKVVITADTTLYAHWTMNLGALFTADEAGAASAAVAAAAENKAVVNEKMIAHADEANSEVLYTYETVTEDGKTETRTITGTEPVEITYVAEDDTLVTVTVSAVEMFKAADAARVEKILEETKAKIAAETDTTDPDKFPELVDIETRAATMTPEQVNKIMETVREQIEKTVKQIKQEAVAEINSGNMTTAVKDTKVIEDIQNDVDRHPNTTVPTAGLPSEVGQVDSDDLENAPTVKEPEKRGTNLSKLLIYKVGDDAEFDQYSTLLTSNPAVNEEEIEKIEATFGSNTRLIEVYDFRIELFKNGDFEDYIYDANGLLVVKIDYPTEGKDAFQIYRYHNYGTKDAPDYRVDMLNEKPNEYNEYIKVLEDGSGIEMHVRFFCTYALAYDKEVEATVLKEAAKTFSGSWHFSSQVDGETTHKYGEAGFDDKDTFTLVFGTDTVELTSALYREWTGTKSYKIIGEDVIRITLNDREELNAKIAEEDGKQFLKIEQGDNKAIYLEKDPVRSGGGAVPAEKYTVTCGEGVTVDKTEASKGTKITVKVADGYENVVVKDAEGNTVTVTNNTFKMPESDVTVSASKKAVAYDKCGKDATCVYAKFTDAETTAWYHDGVHFCVENGYMNGVSETQFAPNGTLSRAMIVTMLWRMAGSPVVDYAMSFTDVADGQWYTEAIRWAQSTGVVNGYDAESFGTNDNITREQLASILMRYAALKGVDVAKKADLAKFDDAASISSWALESVEWANAAGILNGRTETTIAPTGNATRAEAAAMVQRFCETVLSK